MLLNKEQEYISKKKKKKQEENKYWVFERLSFTNPWQMALK